MEVTSSGNDLFSTLLYITTAVVVLVFVISVIRSFIRGYRGQTSRQKPARSRPASRRDPPVPAAAPPAQSIFISYRRDDTAGYAGRLYDRLRGSFAKERLFMDIDNIPPGHDFVEVLDNAIASCNVVLVLIGKQWLTITGTDGARRLDDPHDFVRLEIAAALRRNIRVIPVLVRGATMPPESALPPDLRAMARRQAFAITDDDFHHDVDRLIAAIKVEDNAGR